MRKNSLILLFSAFLISFAPLFAKFIDLSAGTIIWWRCLISCLILGAILSHRKQLHYSRSQLPTLALSGVLLGLHWWTFFLSIQLSSVSIGVLTLFTYPLITAILEPFTTHSPLSMRQLLGGIGIVGGVYFLVPEFSLSNTITIGALVGVFSAFVYAGRNVLTASYLSNVDSMTILWYQMAFGFLVISIFLLFSATSFVLPTTNDFILLGILSIVFTVAGHGLMTYCFKLFSASTVGIVGSLQVVSSTLLAFIFLSEVPDIRFYFGGLIIVSIAIYELMPRKVSRE